MEYFDNDEFWQWIDLHADDDVTKLRLAWRGRQPWIEDAVRQIECRRKYRRKLGEEIRYERFYFPTVLSCEQSTGDELAAAHVSLVPQDAVSVVDLTAGLGVDILTVGRMRPEIRLTAVERQENLVEALRHNAGIMGVSVEVIGADCRDYIEECGRYDIAFIDPARRDSSGGRVYGLADCEPDVVGMLPALCGKVSRLIVKMSPMLDVSQTIREIPGITDLWALGTATECKELVAICCMDSEAGMVEEPYIHAMTPRGCFSFTRSEEQAALPLYGLPEAGGWLYEPSPAVMKVAPWRLLSARYDVGQLHPNTHLFFSPEPVEDFPGEGRRIIEVLPFASSVIKQLSRRYTRMQVAVRNFVMSADKLASKLHARESASAVRIVGATVAPDKPILIVLEGK